MKKYLSIFILLINNVFTSNVYADNHMENYQNKIKAANQGDVSAQYNLGVMYSNGYGVIKNYTLSYMWLILAKYHNDNYADNAINNIKNRMTSVQVNKSQKMARICFESGYTKCN